MKGAIVITHGGVGAKEDMVGRPMEAAGKGLAVLEGGGSALDAAVEAAVILEDDPAFNAGTGSRFRIDGKTIEMDASLMASDGRMAAVAAVRNVRNPVRLARLVMDTPHVMMVGQGASDYAYRMGMNPYDPATEDTRAFIRKAWKAIREGKVSPYNRKWLDFRNYDLPSEGCDTIGAVVRDARGNFAVANSTGGTSLMLPGRVGDSPIFGAGFWAGPAGAVAATGIGEEIIRKLLCKQVYDRIESGMHPAKACEWGVGLYPPELPVGLIAVGRKAWGKAANMTLPVGIAESAPAGTAKRKVIARSKSRSSAGKTPFAGGKQGKPRRSRAKK